MRETKGTMEKTSEGINNWETTEVGDNGSDS